MGLEKAHTAVSLVPSTPPTARASRPAVRIRRSLGCSCLVVAARVPLFWAGGWRR